MDEVVSKPDVVTSENAKNPGRVEWGRKLGKMSKERKKLKNETDLNKSSTPHKEIIVVGVLLAIACLYFWKPVQETKPQPIVVEKPKIKSFNEF